MAEIFREPPSIERAVQYRTDNALRWLLGVLESGRDLGFDCPTYDDDLKQRVRSVRQKLVQRDLLEFIHGELPPQIEDPDASWSKFAEVPE